MEREPDVLRDLVRFLVQHGYPPTGIIPEFKFGPFVADIAVVDPTSGKPVAVFELKRRRTRDDTALAALQLRNYSKVLGSNVSTYLVYPNPGAQPPLHVLRVSAMPNSPEPIVDEVPVPDFALLANKAINSAIQENRKEKSQAVRGVFAASWLSAALALCLLLLDLGGKIAMTAPRVALLGAVLGLAILPFAGKLKILGVEYERYVEKSERGGP